MDDEPTIYPEVSGRSVPGDRSSYSSPFKPGDVIRQRFKLIELLGQGGMSDVYLAEDLLRVQARDRDSRVAIKLLHSDLSKHPDALAILQREAALMIRLAHPNIAQVYDFDLYEGVPYMVMEYVKGKSLDTEEAAAVLARVAGQVGTLRSSELVSLITTWPPPSINSFRIFLKGEPKLTGVVEQLSYLRRAST